jgi:hypothetical protein
MQMITQNKSVQFEMFSEEGNLAVAEIVKDAQQLNDINEGPVQLVLDWAINELYALSKKSGFEEATDTAVREAVLEQLN